MTRVIPLGEQQLRDIEAGGVYRSRKEDGEDILIGTADSLSELDESLVVIQDGREIMAVRDGPNRR